MFFHVMAHTVNQSYVLMHTIKALTALMGRLTRSVGWENGPQQGLFVCVEISWPSQPNGVMSSVVSLPNHTFTGQA